MYVLLLMYIAHRLKNLPHVNFFTWLKFPITTSHNAHWLELSFEIDFSLLVLELHFWKCKIFPNEWNCSRTIGTKLFQCVNTSFQSVILIIWLFKSWTVFYSKTELATAGWALEILMILLTSFYIWIWKHFFPFKSIGKQYIIQLIELLIVKTKKNPISVFSIIPLKQHWKTQSLQMPCLLQQHPSKSEWH